MSGFALFLIPISVRTAPAPVSDDSSNTKDHVLYLSWKVLLSTYWLTVTAQNSGCCDPAIGYSGVVKILTDQTLDSK